MNVGLYYQFAEIEDNHWWFMARRYLIRHVLIKSGIDKFGKALDIGCGVGGNVNFLQNFCAEVTGIDYSETAINLAKKKWPMNSFVQGDANNLTSLFNANSLDLVTILNVLYHQWIKSDEGLLTQVSTILKHKGYLVITEPAFGHLWRSHDVQDMGKKRYTLKEMKILLKQSGFIVVSGSYFNSICYLPVLLSALLYKLLGKKNIPEEKNGVAEIRMPNNVLNRLMYFLLKMETWLIKFAGKIPVGVSLICIAKKA